MNYDIVIESLRLLVTTVIVLTLVRQFRDRHLEGQDGLPLIRWGFGLILFGTVLDLSDNYPALGRFVIVGDTEAEAILEKLVGYLGGFTLLAFGLVRWLPLLRAGQAARDRLATIHDSMNDALLVHTVDDWRIIEVNQKACDMFGYTRSEFQSLKIADLSSEENPYPLARATEHNQLAMAGQPQIFEWLARDKAGNRFWVEVNIRSATIDGERTLLAIVRDLSQRKRAEENLAAEKERLSVTLRAIAEGVITTDTAGKVVLVNAAAEALSGWKQEEARGQDLNQVLPLRQQSGAPAEDSVARVLREGAVVEDAAPLVLTGRDGRERIVARNGAPIRDPSSNLVGVVLVFRDVSEEYRREAETRRAQQLESLGILAGGIAHDFNNILSGIMGNVSLCQELPGASEQVKDRLAEVEKASLRARNLTRQLLTFARGAEPVRHAFQMADLIRETGGFILRGSNVRLAFTPAEALWTVAADEGQIGQVLNNLILNAAQAMPTGGVVTVAADNVLVSPGDQRPLQAGRYVRVTVADTGHGIPEEYLGKIFDPYFTTKQSGNGLGLAMVLSIVKKHGGHVEVTSKVGAGSTFIVYIPAGSGVGQPADEALRTGPVTGSRRILVLDDEEVVRSMAVAVLTNLGHRAESVVEGAAAVDAYRRAMEAGDRFDAVILDMTIPGGMGGLEALRLIREIDPDVRAIVSSGYSNDPVMSRPGEYGFRGVLSKPYRVKDLGGVLAGVLACGD